MPYCPNPDCKHRVRTGKPAEFVEGMTHCSDCGEKLVSEAPFITREGNRPEGVYHISLLRRVLSSADFLKRLGFTLLCLVIYKAGFLIHVPFINQSVGSPFEYLFLLGSKQYISVFALGIMSYVSATISVEILSLFIPPLKEWRASGVIGRMKLFRLSLVLTLLLGLYHGYAIASDFEQMTSAFMLTIPLRLWETMVIALTLTAGMFLLLWLAHLISQRGLGHGISVLIITGILTGFISNILHPREIGMQMSRFHFFVLAILLFGTLLFITMFFERLERRLPVTLKDGTKTWVPQKITTAGIKPAYWASSITLLLIPAANYFGFTFSDSVNLLMRGIVLLLLYYLLTVFFQRPSEITRDFPLTASSEAFAQIHDRKLMAFATLGAGYLVAFSYMSGLPLHGFEITLSGLSAIILAAVFLDIKEQAVLFATGQPLIKVADFHSVQAAGLTRNILRDKGIPCALRGYYHRALLYFFGPYIEISVLVPEDKARRAIELLEGYGLTKFLIR